LIFSIFPKQDYLDPGRKFHQQELKTLQKGKVQLYLAESNLQLAFVCWGIRDFKFNQEWLPNLYLPHQKLSS